MLTLGASDLHLSPHYPPLVRRRGDLVPVAGWEVLTPEGLRALVAEVLTPAQTQQYEAEHDVDFAYAYLDRARFRGNLMGKHTGMGAVFRTIPSRVLSCQELGLPDFVDLAVICVESGLAADAALDRV